MSDRERERRAEDAMCRANTEVFMRAMRAEREGELTMEGLRTHIAAVIEYNWSKEYEDALENGTENHVINHLVALAAFIGDPLSEDQRAELYGDEEE